MSNHISIHVVAAVVIIQDGKILLVQEARSDIYGLWNIPAGGVEEGMTLLETAIKEVKEETGFDVKILRELDIVHEIETKDVKHVYLGEVCGGALQNFPNEEILDARWFTFDEVRGMEAQLRSPWIIRWL